MSSLPHLGAEPNVEQPDLAAVERELCRLPDVHRARVNGDDAAHVAEVVVTVRPGSEASRIARDVRSIALASFGLDLAPEVVSVTPADDPVPVPRPAPRNRPARAAVVAVTAEADGLRALVRVTLVRNDDLVVGFAEGSVATTARHRLVATATVDALRRLDPAAACIDIDHAEILRVGTNDVAVVTVVFVVPPSEELVSGSAMVLPERERTEAVARAVLDATNRRLSHVPLR